MDGPVPTRAPIRRVRALALLAGLVIALAACDATVPPTTPTSPVPTVALGPTTTPTARPTPRPTPTPTPSPTPSPTPTATPSPTPSPTSATADDLVTPCPGTHGDRPSGRTVGGRARAATGPATWPRARRASAASRRRGRSPRSAVAGRRPSRSSTGSASVGTTSARSSRWGPSRPAPDGTRINAAWRESLPKERYSVRTATSIRPGDRIWAQVRWLGGSRYRLSLANLTNRQHFSVRTTNTTLKRSTAEWVRRVALGRLPERTAIR